MQNNKRIRSASHVGLLVAVAMVSLPFLAMAEEATKKGVSKAPAPPPSVEAKSAVPIPDISKLTLMIQLHVAALSLANLTGNYTVLHALGSPTFQAENSPPKLAENFAPFRSKGLDISPALLFPPILVGPAQQEANGVIRVAGFYNTSPQRIVFEIAFQAVDNAWRLADIKVQTVVPAPVAQATPPAPTAPPADAPAKAAKATAVKK